MISPETRHMRKSVCNRENRRGDGRRIRENFRLAHPVCNVHADGRNWEKTSKMQQARKHEADRNPHRRLTPRCFGDRRTSRGKRVSHEYSITNDMKVTSDRGNVTSWLLHDTAHLYFVAGLFSTFRMPTHDRPQNFE